MPKLFFPKSSSPCMTSAQWPEPAKASFCMTMPVPTRPRSQNHTYRNRTSKSWTVPPYSPDLAPCDFWLVSKLKEWLAGRQCTRVQDLPKATISECDAIPALEYQNAIQMWRRWLEFCVASGRMYCEGLKEFGGGMFTGFRFTSVVTGLLGWTSYDIIDT